MEAKHIHNKIIEHGHWRYNLHPQKFQTDRIADLDSCRDLVRSASVLLRGWDCPHFPTNNQQEDIYIVGDHVEAWIDWKQYKEVWRMYQSGLFTYVFGLSDDWMAEASGSRQDWYGVPTVGTELDSVEIVLRLTELYLFARRMVDTGKLGDHVSVSVEIVGTANRMLTLKDPRSFGMLGTYKCRAPSVVVPEQHVSREDSTDEILASALTSARYVFTQFQLGADYDLMYKDYQRRLIDRTL